MAASSASSLPGTFASPSRPDAHGLGEQHVQRLARSGVRKAPSMPSSNRRYRTSTGCRDAVRRRPRRRRPAGARGPPARASGTPRASASRRCSNQALSLSPAVRTAIRGVPVRPAAPRPPGRRAAPGRRPTGRHRRAAGQLRQRGAGAVPVGQRVAQAGRHPQVVGGGHPLAGRRPQHVHRGHGRPRLARARPARPRRDARAGLCATAHSGQHPGPHQLGLRGRRRRAAARPRGRRRRGRR